MKSKEALQYIENVISNDTYYMDLIKEHIEVINKDLELLEILREHFSCTEYGYWYIEMSQSDFDYEGECTKEEWENSPQKKIEEWLKGK